METVADFIFWAPKSLQMTTVAMKLQKAVTKGTAWPWPLREQRTERIPKENWLAAGRPLARQRQRGRHVTAVARRRGAISAAEMASSTKL